MASYALGIDIGGTFTDIVLYDRRNAAHHTRKVLTAPDDPARGVIAGLTELLEGDGLDARGIRRLVHATTPEGRWFHASGRFAARAVARVAVFAIEMLV